jgi:hypothetical protein
LQALSHTATSFLKAEERERTTDDGFNGFLTIPDVEVHFRSAIMAMEAIVLAYAPTLVEEQYFPWTNYSTVNQDWTAQEADPVQVDLPESVPKYIWKYSVEANDLSREIVPPRAGSVHNPIWQQSPLPTGNRTQSVNFDLTSVTSYRDGFDIVSLTRRPTFLDIQDHAKIFQLTNYSGEHAQTSILYPVFSSFKKSATIVGHIVAVVPWSLFFEGELAEGSQPIEVVVSNTCGQSITFVVTGRSVKFIGNGDLHTTGNAYYEELEVLSVFANEVDDASLDSKTCVYSVSVYPTKEFEDSFTTSQPLYMALTVVMVFFVTAVAFTIFDYLAKKRETRILNTAKKQNAIMSSLFPKSIKKQLMAEVEEHQFGKSKLSSFGKAGLRSFLNDEGRENLATTTDKPIADLFPETTIMFADISGFTAWSSAREPSQVFTLLETIYREFDRLAKRRRVFKVEVVGDCYVRINQKQSSTFCLAPSGYRSLTALLFFCSLLNDVPRLLYAAYRTNVTTMQL